MCCGKEGHKKADCKFKTSTCSNCGKGGHLRAVCRNTNTHEIEKDADEPSPEVIVEAVWCMAVRDTVDGGHCDCIEKHDVSSEHRDESKFTEFPKHRDESKFTEFPKHRDESKFKKSHHEHRDGSKFGQVFTKIEMGEQDSDGRQKSRHERIRAERVDGSKIAARNTQRIRHELADGSTIKARQTERIRDELVHG